MLEQAGWDVAENGWSSRKTASGDPEFSLDLFGALAVQRYADKAEERGVARGIRVAAKSMRMAITRIEDDAPLSGPPAHLIAAAIRQAEARGMRRAYEAASNGASAWLAQLTSSAAACKRLAGDAASK